VELNVGIFFFGGDNFFFPFFVFQLKNWESVGTFFFLVEIGQICFFCFWGGGIFDIKKTEKTPEMNLGIFPHFSP
jgi:hypothetical protein